MKNSKFNIFNSKIDCVSKFNIYDKKFISNLDNLFVFSKLSLNDPNFLRDFFFLSKLFFFWFNKKISILQIIKDKKRTFNKGKSSLTFFFGCTVRKKGLIKNVNYINNVVFNMAKKVDGYIKHKKTDFGFMYTFSNINFLLGFKSERFFNLNIKINVFYNFSVPKNIRLNKNLINFHEKVFF